MKQPHSANDRTIVSAASIGRHQEHTVSVAERRVQVASERRSVDIQQPARCEFATIVGANLRKTRELFLKLHQHFSQAISVQRNFRNTRAAASNSK
jgi:hypothetical protein